jgi:hypothetical protein
MRRLCSRKIVVDSMVLIGRRQAKKKEEEAVRTRFGLGFL